MYSNSQHTTFFYLQPKLATTGSSNGGNYGYYHSNATGNYGNYNHAFTASPSQQLQTKSGVPTYDNYIATEAGPNLNIDRPVSKLSSNTNRYSLHVRASPISPTYSQFSSGVSVKNAYPPYNTNSFGGNGYGGGGLKNASFDYVPSDQLRHYRYSASHVPDNYAVYVNSTNSPLPVVPIHHHQHHESGIPSTSSSNVSPATQSSVSGTSVVKTGSLATHV
jgi:hypothetical protein